MERLRNAQIDLLVSDPRELGTECGVGPHRGIVVELDEGALVVRLVAPVSYQGKTLVAAIVWARHADSPLPSLLRVLTVGANFLFLPRLESAKDARDAAHQTVPAIGSVELPTAR